MPDYVFELLFVEHIEGFKLESNDGGTPVQIATNQGFVGLFFHQCQSKL
jgi:hypothetical protein